MRAAIHQVLTGLPGGSIALGGLWATAFPEKAAKNFNAASSMLSNPYIFWLGVFLILAYVALWWLSGREIPSRHQILVMKGLQPIYVDLGTILGQIKNAEDVSSLTLARSRGNAVLECAQQWLSANMGQQAALKASSSRVRVNAAYVGQGDANLENSRILLKNEISDRLDNIETLIVNPAWDGQLSNRKFWEFWKSDIGRYASPLRPSSGSDGQWPAP